EELLRRDDHAALALYRLREDRRDEAGGLGPVDQPFELFDPGPRHVGRRAALGISIRIGVVGEEDLPDQRTEALAVRLLLPGEADVQQGPPVKRGLEGGEPSPL